MGVGHQANRVYIYPLDSVSKGGMTYPQYKEFRPWHISKNEVLGEHMHERGLYLKHGDKGCIGFWRLGIPLRHVVSTGSCVNPRDREIKGTATDLTFNFCLVRETFQQCP